MSTTVVTNPVSGEITIVIWTQEEIQARIQRMTPVMWGNLRSERNARLGESDAYVLPDRWATYTPDQQAAWTAYRQALRDLPENTTDPFNPVWPVKPT